MFTDGIITDFKPRFRSISKDCDRYFDMLFDLNEAGHIPTNEVLNFSSAGNLWISKQYIDEGHLDLVKADLKSDVCDRDFYGPLFENTCQILDYLLDNDHEQIVVETYETAILHRFKAIKTEHKVKHAKFIKHYLPALLQIIKDFRELIGKLGQDDPKLDAIIFELQKIASYYK